MDNKVQNLIDLLKTASPKRTFVVLGFILVVLAIPFTANLAQKQQNLEQEAARRDGFCADVITPAKNITTGECQTFPNSCIPDDFMPDSECGEEAAPSPSESEESDSVCGNGVCETGEETVFCADPDGSISLGTDMSQFGCFPACRVDCSDTAKPDPTRTPKQDDAQDEENDTEDSEDSSNQNDQEDEDIVDDDQVDLLDYNVLISCSIFGKDNKKACMENPEFEKRADLNKDGKIDHDDYNIFLRLLLRASGLTTLPVITPLPSPTPIPTPTPSPISGNQKILCDGRTFSGWGSTAIFEIGKNPDDNNPNIVKVIRNCTFKNTSGTITLKPPVRIEKANNVLIENSRFENIRTGAQDDVVAIAMTGKELAQNIVIRNNVFTQISSDGLQPGPNGPNVRNLTIENNEFIGSEDWGENAIDVKGVYGPILIKNNKIHGFRPCQSSKTKVQGTQDCTGSRGPAITIHVGSTGFAPQNVTIEGNDIYDNTFGITMSGGSGITIRNNSFRNNITRGIEISGGSSITLSGNTYSGNKGGNCKLSVSGLTCQ